MIAKTKIMMAAAGGLLVLAGGFGPAASVAEAREYPVVELMKTPHLPDIYYGSPDAKVTIIEYASITCGACGAFHKRVLPELKKKYIDTGKVRLILREFPLNARAYAGSMLVRCAAEGKQVALADILFRRQDDWAFVKTNPKPKLFDIVKQAGFTEERFEKCLTDDALLEKLTARMTRASEAFGVNRTPSFFINGKLLEGGATLANFEKTLDPLLAEGTADATADGASTDEAKAAADAKPADAKPADAN